jgi:TetR/AcrR family transcriptional regulator, repressor for uid operon
MVKAGRRRTESPEVRRAQILKAAKVRFRTVGFHETRVAEIADLAGVSVGLVYQYFPGKEALIAAIVAEDMQSQMREFEAALDASQGNAADVIEHLAKSLRAIILDRERTALMIEIAAETARSDKIKVLARSIQTEASERLHDRLSRLIPTGMSAAELEVRLHLLSGLVTGAGIQFYSRPDLDADLLFKLAERAARNILAPL